MKKRRILLFGLVVGLLLAIVRLAVCRSEDVVQSEICTTKVSNGWAVNYPKQRKLFVMCDLIWVFYSDGNNAVYRTSADGLSWRRPLVVRSGGSLGHRMGCCFDGRHIHYAYCGASDGEDVVYRRGEPTKEGTIIWSLREQTAYKTPGGRNVMYPKVIVDSLGFPWIAFMLYDGGFNTSPYDAIVTKSSAGDGTWKTAAGFEYVLVNDNTTSYPDALGVAMTNGRTFWVYNKNVMDDTYYGRYWDGRRWYSEETVTKSRSSYGLYSLVADVDAIHLVFGGGTIRYRKRSFRTGWGQEYAIGQNASGHTSITRTGRDSLAVTWLDPVENRIWYREMADGRWKSPVEWVDESADGLANARLGINSNGFVDSSSSWKLGLAYTTGSAPSYKLKFVGLPR